MSVSEDMWRHHSTTSLLLLLQVISSLHVPRGVYRRRVVQYAMDSDNIGASGTDADIMASLRKRATAVTDRQTRLPVVVLDTMLPRQVLRIESSDQTFCELIRQLRAPQFDGSTFAMVGMWAPNRETVVPMANGVEVSIQEAQFVKSSNIPGKETTEQRVRVVLRGGRRLKITGEIQTNKQGWTEARVCFAEESDKGQSEEDAIDFALARDRSAKFLDESDGTSENSRKEDRRAGDANAPIAKKSLVERWVELARQRERSHRQIDTLLEETLGCDLAQGREYSFAEMVADAMPSANEPSERALWIGALINPLPGMGVALEIRPQLLNSTSAKERVDIALHGLRSSIRHMSGEEPLW